MLSNVVKAGLARWYIVRMWRAYVQLSTDDLYISLDPVVFDNVSLSGTAINSKKCLSPVELI
jgi:hypothetical protein